MAETKKTGSSDDGKFDFYEMDLNAISEEFAKEAGFMKESKPLQKPAEKKPTEKKKVGQRPTSHRVEQKRPDAQRPTGHRIADQKRRREFEEFEIEIPAPPMPEEETVFQDPDLQETAAFEPVTEQMPEPEMAEEIPEMTFRTPHANLEDYTENVPPRIKDTFSEKAEQGEYEAPSSFATMFIPLHGDSAGTLVKKGIIIVSVLVILICVIALGVHAITGTIAVPALAVIAPDTVSKSGRIAAGMLL